MATITRTKQRGNIKNLALLIVKAGFKNQHEFSAKTRIKRGRLNRIISNISKPVTDDEFENIIGVLKGVSGSKEKLERWRKAARTANFRKRNAGHKPTKSKKSRQKLKNRESKLKTKVSVKRSVSTGSISQRGMDQFYEISKEYGKPIPSDLAVLLMQRLS
jgi:hypothetical protein